MANSEWEKMAETINSLLGSIREEDDAIQSNASLDEMLESIRTEDVVGQPTIAEQQALSTSQDIRSQVERSPPGLDDPGTRFAISAAEGADVAGTRQAKLAAFRRTYPEGDLIFDQSAKVLNFRKNPTADFAKIDADLLEGPGGEFISDVLEFVADDFGAIMGELAAAAPEIATSVAGGPAGAVGKVSLLKMMGEIGFLKRAGAGVFAGELAQAETENFLGFGGNEETRQVLEKAFGKGALTIAGGWTLDVAGRPIIDAARGAGFFSLRRGVDEAIKAADRLGIKQFPVNLVAKNPFLRRVGSQAMALTSRMTDWITDMEVSNAAALSKYRDTLTAGAFPSRNVLAASLRKEEQALTSNFQKLSGRNAETDLTKQGQLTIKAVDDYDRAAKGDINIAYAKARQKGSPEFELNAPTVDQGRGLRDDMAIVAEDARSVGSEATQIGRLAETIGKIEDGVPDKILDLPSGEQYVLSGVDQLRRLRSIAFDLKNPAPGELPDQGNRLAAKVFRSLTDVLDNPKNADKGFVQAWGDASKMARKRFENMEQVVIINAAKSKEPTALAAQLSDLSNPANADAWKTLRRVLPRAKFNQIQDGLATQLLRDPYTITEKLLSATPEVLRQAFDPKMLRSAELAGQGFDSLARVGIREAVQKQSELSFIARTLVERGDTQAIDTLAQIVNRNGGHTGALGKTLRAGVVDDLVKNSMVIEEGLERVDFVKLQGMVDNLINSGGDKLLTKRDLSLIKDVASVQDVLRISSDAGTSLQAASAAAALRGSITGGFDAALKGAMTFIESIGVGRMLTESQIMGIPIKKFLIGTGKQELSPSALLRFAGGTAALMADDVVSGTVDSTIEAYSSLVDAPNLASPSQ